MPLAVRYRNAVVQSSRAPDGIIARSVADVDFMARLQGRMPQEIAARYAAGHRAYVAFVYDEPAAWGWVATRSAEIGELRSTFSIASRERYLWNFVTLPAFRGRGIYPFLIEAIIAAESYDADRFWIAYAPENHSSGAGIRKAGFRTVAELSFDGEGRPAVYALESGGGALAAQVLGMPETKEALAECWRCVRAGRTAHFCPAGECSCDYQKPELPCHAA